MEDGGWFGFGVFHGEVDDVCLVDEVVVVDGDGCFAGVVVELR